MPYGYGYRRKRKYRITGNRSAYNFLGSRYRRAYMAKNRYNRGVLASARRVDQAVGLRGFLPGSSLERKFNDITFNAVAISTTAATATVTIIAQGLDVNARIGNKILVKSIQMVGTFRQQLATDGAVSKFTPAALVRMMIWVDRQPNGVLATATEILAASGAVLSPLNPSYRDRFVILKDKFYTLDFASSTATAGQLNGGGAGCIKLCKFYKKVRIPITFSGTTSGVASISTNHIGILLIGQDPGGTDIDAIFDGYLRLRYYDA